MNLTNFQPKYWGTWLLVPILWLLRLCSLSMIYKLGTTLGHILFIAMPARRNIALINLKLCFPDYSHEKVEKIAKQSFQNIARVTLSSGINWWSNEKHLRKLVRVKDSSIFDQALASGRNLIILAPHFVALEIGGIYLSLNSPISSIYQRSRNPIFNRLTVHGRSRFGLTLIERQSNTRNIIRETQNGVPLYYLPDQDPGLQWDPKKAVFAPFFGVEAATWTTLARLAKITNAIVLPCATKILSNGTGFEITFAPPLKDFPSGDQVLDAIHMNYAIEAFIRQMPDQYFWVHKRFKTQPTGGPDYYD